MTPHFDPLALGNLARIFHDIPLDAVRRVALAQANEPGTPFGELFVRLGILSATDVTWLLVKQGALRRGRMSDADLKRIVDFASEQTKKRGEEIAAMLKRKP